MNNSDNTQLLLTAIDDYELYSKSHRKLLKALVSLSIDNIASINVPYLIKTLKLSKALVYNIIKELEEDKFIERIRVDNTKHDSFKINDIKLKHVITLYNKKRELIEKM